MPEPTQEQACASTVAPSIVPAAEDRPPRPPSAQALLAEEISRTLGETKWQPLRTIRRLLVARGEPFVRELVQKAQEIEAAGGLFLESQKRRRTLGGVFFVLAKEAVGAEKWALINPPPAFKKPKPKEPAAAPALKP